MNCPECADGVMVLRQSKYGPFYGCSNFPRCRATHGAHPNGKPLGTPADKETKEARMKAHEVFDAFWKERKLPRGKAYAWMEQEMCLERGKGHIALFDKKQCEALIWHCQNYLNMPNIITTERSRVS